MKKIKCIIFDYGCVLSNKQLEVYVEKMLNIIGIDKDVFLRDYFAYRLDYDRGVITANEYWSSILNNNGILLDQTSIDLLIDYDVKSWTSINEEMIAFVNSIRGSLNKLAILSNMNIDVLNHIDSNCDWLEYFEHKVYSCNLLDIKPEEIVYKKTINTIGLKSYECLFVDDSLDNILAAKDFGINTIHYIDFDTFIDELNKNFILDK